MNWQQQAADARDQYVGGVKRAVITEGARRTSRLIWDVADDAWDFHKRRYREWKAFAQGTGKWAPTRHSEKMEESKEVHKAVGKAVGSRIAALHRSRVPVTGRVSLSSIRRGRGRRRFGRRGRSRYRGRSRFRRRSYRRRY